MHVCAFLDDVELQKAENARLEATLDQVLRLLWLAVRLLQRCRYAPAARVKSYCNKFFKLATNPRHVKEEFIRTSIKDTMDEADEHERAARSYNDLLWYF